MSVIQCERKYTAFASKLLQTQTKSIIFTNCNLQQTAFYYRSGVGKVFNERATCENSKQP